MARTVRKSKRGVKFRDGEQGIYVPCSKSDKWPCTYCFPERNRGLERYKSIQDQLYADRHAATIAAPFTTEEYARIREWARKKAGGVN